MGGGNEHYARHTIGMFQEICNYLGMERIEVIIAPGMTDRKSAQENQRLIELAKKAGTIATNHT